MWESFFSFHACFDRRKFLLFYSLHMIAISVRSWRRRKLFSVSKKLIGQLGSLWGQACLRTAWSPLSDVFLISSSRDFLDLLLSDSLLVSPLQISPFLSFPTLPDILFNKSESDLRRIHLCQLLENSISPPAAPAQEINTSEVPPFPLYLEILSCLQPI